MKMSLFIPIVHVSIIADLIWFSFILYTCIIFQGQPPTNIFFLKYEDLMLKELMSVCTIFLFTLNEFCGQFFI